MSGSVEGVLLYGVALGQYLSTPDIEAAYQELKARGVEPTSEIADDGWGKWFGMSDPDGNKWLIVQS
jgi:uncharacterized glyoxalase superfamily protein PhnB